MPEFNRRRVLQMLGGTAAASTLPWFVSRSAHAGPEDVPLRLLLIDVGTGVLRNTWEPVVPEGAPPVLRGEQWALRGAHEAYAAYKSRLTVFQNLDMKSAKEDPTPANNAHINGHTHQLTAAFRPDGDGADGGGISFDQFVARQLNDPEPLTRLPSLEISTDRASGASYSGPGERLPYEQDAEEVWNRLFPDDFGEAAMQRARRRAQTVDFVRGEYDRLLGRLGAEDRTKIEQMRQLRSDLERRRNLVSSRAGNRPEASLVDPYRDLGREVYAAEHYPLRVDIMSKMAAAALHTDSTRVVSLRISRPPDADWGYTRGQWGTRDWHDLDHKVSGRNVERDLSDPVTATERITRMQRMVADNARRVLDELDSLSETDGGTLLDHTLVLITSHIADGSHDITRLPWIVVGDAHGQLRTDQHVRFLRYNWRNDDPPSYEGNQWNTRGRPHNDLFTTLANAMGVSTDTFGERSVASGPITEMLA
jgi:hypothetical protein